MVNHASEKQLAKGVYLRISKFGVKSIRIQFCYRKKLYRETLRINPTIKNIKKARTLRKRILKKIALGEFNYFEFFPDSKNAARLGHAPRKILIKDLLNKFLDQSKDRLEQSTHSRYRRVCKVHLLPKFGEMAIQELKPIFIWEWLQKLACKKKTIINILTPFRAIVAEALIFGHIDKNPFDSIDISRLRKEKSNYVVNPFNMKEIQQLLDAAEGQIKNMLQLAFYTGLRTSELIGLRWEDIDFDHEVIHVRRAVVCGKEKSTKTRSSIRKILLGPTTLNALMVQRRYTQFLGARVFHNPKNNQPWKSSEQLYRRAWLPLFQKTNVPYRNLYQTRHTYASMMVSGGENVAWVSRQMGHETLNTTFRFYMRWIDNPYVLGGYQPVNQW